MPFELHISIPDQSPAIAIVRQLAEAEHITPEQAGAQLLIEGATHHGQRSPDQEEAEMNEAVARSIEKVIDLRAQYALKNPDAIHLATGLLAGCELPLKIPIPKRRAR